MSKNRQYNKGNKQGAPKQKNVFAWAGFELASRPFLIDDILTEPTKTEQRDSAYEYIPFDTFDLYRLDRLQAITNNSPTTASIIDQKVASALGNGFYAVPAAHYDVLRSVRESRAAQVEITPEALETLNDFLRDLNPEGDNIDMLFEKVACDFVSFGNAFVEHIRIKVGSTTKYFARLLPITWCRPKKAEQDEMYPTHIGVTSEFEEGYIVTPKKALDYPIFPHFAPVSDHDKEEGVERCIMHLKCYEPTMIYWGVPDWISAKIWAEMEYRIAKYNQSKFENGFTPSAIITAYGSQTEEEAVGLVNALKGCFTQTGNNSKMFIQALRNKADKMDVDILETHNEGEFLELQDMARQAIITAHGWTASLAGLTTPGALGTNQQMRSEFDKVYAYEIRPLQKLLLCQFVNPMIQAAGEWLGEKWEGIALDITKAMPVTFAGDINPSDVMTKAEMRKELGLPPLDNTQENGNTD